MIPQFKDLEDYTKRKEEVVDKMKRELLSKHIKKLGLEKAFKKDAARNEMSKRFNKVDDNSFETYYYKNRGKIKRIITIAKNTSAFQNKDKSITLQLSYF